MDSRNKKVVYIEHDMYRLIAKCDHNYDNSLKFDAQCGIRFLYGHIPHIEGSFAFEIVDEKRYILAKIKFGI
jgi:hypothetical protein